MKLIERVFPEVGAGGYTRVDGSVEFYGRVASIVAPSFRVLDLGAGRGAWTDDSCAYRRSLRMLRGRVALVAGHDVDDAVLTNPSVDCATVGSMDTPLPYADEYFDLIIADYVLEHVEVPQRFASEVRRVLKEGGWFCARTPNKWGYISVATRAIRNTLHVRVLRRAQPDRREVDVFPTRFRLNTVRAIRQYFGRSDFENFSYYFQPEPAYHFNKLFILCVMRFVDRLLPTALQSNLFVFLRRKATDRFH